MGRNSPQTAHRNSKSKIIQEMWSVYHAQDLFFFVNKQHKGKGINH